MNVTWSKCPNDSISKRIVPYQFNDSRSKELTQSKTGE
jgi:hypothetical protein